MRKHMPTSTCGTLGELISVQQAVQGINDRQLCVDLGLESLSVLLMIKDGSMLFPYSKIPALAKALSIDARVLLCLALHESSPELLTVLKQVFCAPDFKICERNQIESTGVHQNPLQQLLVTSHCALHE